MRTACGFLFLFLFDVVKKIQFSRSFNCTYAAHCLFYRFCPLFSHTPNKRLCFCFANGNRTEIRANRYEIQRCVIQFYFFFSSSIRFDSINCSVLLLLHCFRCLFVVQLVLVHDKLFEFFFFFVQNMLLEYEKAKKISLALHVCLSVWLTVLLCCVFATSVLLQRIVSCSFYCCVLWCLCMCCFFSSLSLFVTLSWVYRVCLWLWLCLCLCVRALADWVSIRCCCCCYWIWFEHLALNNCAFKIPNQHIKANWREKETKRSEPHERNEQSTNLLIMHAMCACVNVDVFASVVVSQLVPMNWGSLFRSFTLFQDKRNEMRSKAGSSTVQLLCYKNWSKFFIAKNETQNKFFAAKIQKMQ